jgi:hypothetical protein
LAGESLTIIDFNLEETRMMAKAKTKKKPAAKTSVTRKPAAKTSALKALKGKKGTSAKKGAKKGASAQSTSSLASDLAALRRRRFGA